MKRVTKIKRIMAAAMATALILTGLPELNLSVTAAGESVPGTVVTIADPETLTDPVTIYGDSTLNAGKITVGKSVSDTTVDLENNISVTPDNNNFLVTLSQTAQVMGVSTEISVPIDAVFVLDTSGSMEDDDKAEAMVTAANNAISALLAANENNRVAVVAFSSSDSGNDSYGGGTSEGKAANVLSPLYHYTGVAATSHLQWVNSQGSATSNNNGPGGSGDKDYIAGRTTSGALGGYRHGKNGGTHIQAGIALGAQQLTAVTNTTVTIDGKEVTRLPFIVILSDGAPTFSATSSAWYNPTISKAYWNNNWNYVETQQGDGSNPYEGNGFLAALTAAYYKGKITEHYFGEAASENNRCSIYTIGVGIDSLEDDYDREDKPYADDIDLAQITLNPATYTTGTYAAANAATYYNYGNTANSSRNNRNADYGWKSYWNKFNAGKSFSIRVDSDSSFTITADSIAASKDYVNFSGLAYNDDYFETSEASDLNQAFTEVVSAIQMKAISLPTMVKETPDFEGYVHFYDIIGEYMEVKDVKGIVHNGYFFQGKSFAQNMVNFGTSNADEAFDEAVVNALNGRLGLSDSNTLTAAQIKNLVANAVATDNQLYYDESTDAYNNSICWWGSPYMDANGDQQMQMRGFASDDSIEYIQSATIPEGAEYVCRSYYYYGTAGGAIEPVDNFLLLSIRVQTSIKDPYQQTVVVSIPGSLLSLEQVLITEKNADSTPSYVASVQEDDPLRIVYEVGLRSDINAQNVVNIVGDAYKNEVTTDKSGGSVDNYDAEADTYYFYTNDWDRSKTVASHERAMTRAGFDVASDNSFYTYEADTKLYTKNPNGGYTPVTSGVQAGETYYYKRVYYDWEGARQNTDNTYNCVKKEAWITVTAPSTADLEASVIQINGEWYVKAGYYTASSLQVTGDDRVKSENRTGTSTIVSHPKRTNSLDDSHYTVYLGNNGRLALTADKSKTVDINAGTNAQILDADGNAVTVGDILTYKIKVVNNEGAAATAVVTDKVPVGTELVEGSIAFDANGTGATGTGAENNGTITWNITDIPANGVVYVSFKVEVTAAALQGATGTLENTAQVQIGNSPAYNTNTTDNPPMGKVVAGENVNIGITGEDAQGGIMVGQTLIYHIYWANAENAVSDVVITDIIPQGTNYVTNSASDGGVYDSSAKTLTWTMKNVQPGASGVVTFKVIVDATAKSPIENSAEVQIGENGPQVATNPTEVEVLKGNLELTKLVANGGAGYEEKIFTLELVTAGSQMNTGYGLLNGSYVMERSSSSTEETVVFTNGAATVQLKADEKLTIKDLPAGLTLVVTEKNVPGGYTASYSTTNGQVSVTAGATAVFTVTNTYAVNPIEFQLEGSKILDTDDFFPETTFTAVVERCTVDAATGEWKTTGETATTAQAKVSSADKEGEFVFAKRTFTQADIGEHYYLITEFNNHLTGVDYDETQYRMKLVVADDGSGQLTITTTIWEKAEGTQDFVEVPYAESMDNGVLSVHGAVEFTNTYQPVETAVTLTGTKTLANRILAANEFGFEVVEVVNGVEQAGNASTGQNKADGSIEFRPITYHQAGTHTYIIREVDGKLANVSYDKTEYTVTVEVTDKDGRLEAAVTYHTTDGKAPVFGNVYAPGDASVVLNGTKTLTGRDLVDREFTFEVLNAAGKVVSTGQNVGTGTGNIIFTPITIKYDASKQGSYTETLTYTVKEAIPIGGAKDPYMGYDTTEYTIKVDVKYDAETGLLTATAQTGNPAIAFVNEQYPSSVTVTPTGSKTTTVPDGSTANLPADATFSFSVIDTVTGDEVTTGIGAANGNIRFGSLSFTKPGTHTYWIKESNATNVSNGITYDKSMYLMQVVISEKMAATVAYYGYAGPEGGDVSDPANYTAQVNAPTFENTYDANGSLNITATKVLEGRDLKDGEFAFKLVRSDNGGEIDGLAGANGVIQFATLYYSMKDIPEGMDSTVITYQMSEVVPAADKLAGVTYDVSTREVFVKLTDNKDGTITAKLSNADGTVTYDGADTGITFKNIYKATEGTSATMEVTKELNGRDLADGEFTFELWYVDGTSEYLVTTTTNQGEVVSFTRNYLPEAVQFEDSSPYVTYSYVIREQAGNLPGITYATNEIGVQVVVYNNTELGKLEIAGVNYHQYENGVYGEHITDTSLLKFVNTYQSEGTSFIPEATKALENRTMKEDEFSFEVRSLDNDNNVSEKPVSVGLSKADGTVVFTPIGYSDREGTGTSTNRYVISEVKGQLGGITYSEAKYYLKVVVTDEGVGELKAVGTYHTDIACESTPISVADVKFVNTYSTAVGTAQLQADKVLTGRDMAANEFDFIVKAAGTDTVVAYGDNTAAKAGEAAGITFTTISYSLADMQDAVNGVKTFEYTISEVKPVEGHLNGITIDETVYTAKVTVTDNGVGMLIVDPIKYYDKDGNEISTPVFTNVYKPAETDIILNATKVLKEKKLLKNEFFFALKDSAGNIVKDASGKDIQVTNDANGLVTFPALTFEAAGDYTYYVEEVKNVNTDVITDESMQDNYYFDPVSYKVIVTVTDDKAGQLHAVAKYFNADTEVQNMVFANLYTPDQVTVDLSTAIGAVKKVVDANNNVISDYPLSGFQFAVIDIYGNEVTRGTSGADGKITFEDFAFSQADEYRYRISEVASGKQGITDDTRQWELHIHVKNNPDGDNVKDVYGNPVEIGKLYVAELAVYAETGEEAAPEFVNSYKAAPAALTITADKHLSGRPLKAHEFTFRLMEGDLILAEAQNDAEGNITFHIDVNTAGKHVYTIQEIVPEKQAKHIHYDNKVVTVEVTAVEDYSGQMKIEGTKEITVDSGAKFENIYTPSPISVNVMAKKVLNGASLQADAFEFELVDENGTVVSKVTNDAAGMVVFDDIVFTKPDLMGAAEVTRKYTIREVIGNDVNMTYDETEYAVKITVTDDMAGQLHASITYDTDDGEIPVFTNTYTKPVDPKILVQLEGTKVLLGRTMVDGQFKFEVHDSNGILCNTGTSKANGTIDFYEMAMTEGIHVLTVSEVNDGQSGIVYDTGKFEVVVNVYDHYGMLRAEVYYPEGGIAFVNRTAGFVSPVTGDGSPIMLLLAALVVCGGGLSGLLFWKRKKVQK